MGYASKREDDSEQSHLFRQPIERIVRSQERLKHVQELEEEIETCDQDISRLTEQNFKLREDARAKHEELQCEANKCDQAWKALEQRREELRSLRGSSTIEERIDIETRSKLRPSPLPHPLDAPDFINPEEIAPAKFLNDEDYHHYIHDLRVEVKKRHNRINLLEEEQSDLKECTDALDKQIKEIRGSREGIEKRIKQFDEETEEERSRQLKERMERGGYLHDRFREGHKPNP